MARSWTRTATPPPDPPSTTGPSVLATGGPRWFYGGAMKRTYTWRAAMMTLFVGAYVFICLAALEAIGGEHRVFSASIVITASAVWLWVMWWNHRSERRHTTLVK